MPVDTSSRRVGLPRLSVPPCWDAPVGRKIGFTNRTIWAQYGVWAPIWSPVYDSTVHHTSDGDARLAEVLAEASFAPVQAGGDRHDRDPDGAAAGVTGRDLGHDDIGLPGVSITFA